MAKKTKLAPASADNNDDLTAPVITPMTPEECIATLGVPVTKRGNPDLRNHVPKRFIQESEARARGISMFWDGRACAFSHQAARDVSNPDQCSDCKRIRAGKDPIYPTSRAQKFREVKPAAPADPNTATAEAAAPAPKSLGLSAIDTKFLEHFARERDLTKAAKTAGTTPELVMARRVGHPGFDTAMSDLEQRLEIARYMPLGSGFTWDDDKRELFITTYINTGLVEDARQAVGCTRAQWYAELKANAQFSSEVDAARPFAESIIEEAFTKAAKQGQTAILPRYAEILDKRAAQRLDMPSDPAQSRAEVQRILAEVKGLIDRRAGLLSNIKRSVAVRQTPIVADDEDTTASDARDDDDSLTGEI